MIKFFSGQPGFIVAFSVFCLFALSFAGPVAANESASGAPSRFVQNLGDTALMSLTEKKLSRSMREKRVREILENNFDVQTIGRFAMGKYWKGLSESQRHEYMNLFEDMIVQTYTTRFEDYSGQKLKVGTYAMSGNDYIVSSQVIQQDGPPVNLEWRVRPREDGSLKVVDVVVEGVSMSVTQRSDFSAVIQRGGGKVDALLTTLRERKKSAAEKI